MEAVLPARLFNDLATVRCELCVIREEEHPDGEVVIYPLIEALDLSSKKP